MPATPISSQPPSILSKTLNLASAPVYAGYAEIASYARSARYLGSLAIRGLSGNLAPRVTPPPASAAATNDTALSSALPPIIQPTETPEQLLRQLDQKITSFKLPDLQREDVTDWRMMTEQQVELFVTKASMITILTIMDAKIDSALAIDLMNTATQTNRSLLSIYLEQKGSSLGFFARITANLKYLFYYKSGIISNTLEGFMNSLLDKLRSELVEKKGGQNLTVLVDQLISHTGSFLADYHLAITKYAKGEGTGSRDDYLTQELKQPIDRICEAFTQTALREFLPEISLFKKWKQHHSTPVRILAKIIAFIPEWGFNRILRETLKQQIPAVVKSIVTSGTDAAQQGNLPFATAFTRGILQQLQTLKALVQEPPNPAISDAPLEIVPGTEKLPTIVKQLINVLKLEPYKTREELNAFITQPPSSGPISQRVAYGIEQGVIDGARLLLNYISNPKNSEELFYQLLSLTNTTFEATPPTTPEQFAALHTEYNSLQTQMQREARELFQTLIHRSVVENFQGSSEQGIQRRAQAFCLKRREQSHELARRLNTLSSEISFKAAQNTSILNDLSTIIEAVSYYHNQAYLDDRRDFPAPLQKGIDQSLSPVYQALGTLVELTTLAQKEQKKLLDLHQATLSLKDLTKCTQEIQTATISSSLDYVTLSSQLPQLKEKVTAIRLKHYLLDTQVDRLDQLSNQLQTTHQQLLDEHKLCTTLSHLISTTADRLIHHLETSENVLRTDSLKILETQIQLLPSEHRLLLQTKLNLVKSATPKEQMLSACRDLLQECNELHIQHLKQFGVAKEHFKQNAQELNLVSAGSLATSKQLRLSSTKILSQKALEISAAIASFANTSQHILPQPVEPFDAKMVHAIPLRKPLIAASLGLGLGIGLSRLVGPQIGAWAGIAFGLTGGLVSAYRNGGSYLVRGATGALAGAVPGVLGIGSYVLPSILGATGAAVAYKGEELVVSYMTERVVSEVMEVYENLYTFLLQPHVWKWGVIDALDSVTRAYKKP